jgi:phage shock protein A
MSLWSRLKLIFRSKASRALDRAEDPRETLDYSYSRQIELLQEMRRAVAEVATARKRIELQGEQLQKSSDKLEAQARQSIAAGREDLAREAIARRLGIGREIDGLREQHEQLAAQERKLTDGSKRLETQLQEFRTRKETLKATYSAAEAQARVNEAAGGLSAEYGELGQAVQRAEDKIAQSQARASALDELIASGALADASVTDDRIQRELDTMSARSAVDAELRRLKGETPALDSGQSAAPTIPSEQRDTEPP